MYIIIYMIDGRIKQTYITSWLYSEIIFPHCQEFMIFKSTFHRCPEGRFVNPTILCSVTPVS